MVTLPVALLSTLKTFSQGESGSDAGFMGPVLSMGLRKGV